MLDEFNDSEFIPDRLYCETIDNNSPLIMLKHIFDGRICSPYLCNREIKYLDLIKQTNNEFLKLTFFECLKCIISIAEQNRILNSEELIPLYYKVVVNIIKQRNRRYRPMWLIKEYIKSAHKSENPKISNHEMFENVGKILTLIIEDKEKTHMKDIFYILKDFLGLKKGLLISTAIPDDIFRAIEYWINDIFDGNLSEYDITKNLLEKIFDLYEELNIDMNSEKDIIFIRYKQFYNDLISTSIIDIKNIQSIYSHSLFTESLIEITQKYCINEITKAKLENDLKLKYEDLHRKALTASKDLPLIKGTESISIDEIEKALKPFEKDTIQEFLQKVVITDWIIPELPEESNEEKGISSIFPTTVYDDVTRYYDVGDPIMMRSFYYKKNLFKNLILFEHKLKDYDKFDFLGMTYAFIHNSALIDELSKKIFHKSLEHYGRRDFFHCIQTSIFQIERILRALCEKNGILNLYKDDKRKIPKGLEYMIRELKKQKVLSRKILFFIGWLLTGESEIISENIRNKIAHGISDMDQFRTIYTKNNAISIILIYLSLSKL